MRERIIRGRFRPGERISETILAASFGVSRSPIREALLHLEMDGFVISMPNRSTCVWEPTETDIKEIYSMRSVIETLAGELVIQKLTEEDYRNLEAIIHVEEEIIRTGDFFQLIQEDKNFHKYIILRARYKRLAKTWRRMMGQWEMMAYLRFRSNPDVVPPTVVEDHHAILNALRRRDDRELGRVNRAINQRVVQEIIAANLFKKN